MLSTMTSSLNSKNIDKSHVPSRYRLILGKLHRSLETKLNVNSIQEELLFFK